MKTLRNEHLEIAISNHGAELCSLRCNGTEYLWNADPQYWKRHSPVLFPIVGSVWGGVFRVDGREYPMSQHGFARDMDFHLESEGPCSACYVLESSEETLAKYPFPFRLEIGYRLEGRKVVVSWNVTNTGGREMPFQIGAHPAFFYPQFDAASDDRGSFDLECGQNGEGDCGREESLEYILIGERGCADTGHRHVCPARIPIRPSTFDRDALIFDRSQVGKVTLNAPDGTPWISLSFDAPLVGLWSPGGKNAPFVCIEPWYGRCDRVGFTGDFAERDEVQALAPGESFTASYAIKVE